MSRPIEMYGLTIQWGHLDRYFALVPETQAVKPLARFNRKEAKALILDAMHAKNARAVAEVLHKINLDRLDIMAFWYVLNECLRRRWLRVYRSEQEAREAVA